MCVRKSTCRLKEGALVTEETKVRKITSDAALIVDVSSTENLN